VTPAVEALGPAALLMARLCEIPSPSHQEAAVAEFVRHQLHELGAQVDEDDAARTLGAGCGNILARFPATAGADGTPVMFAAHLDTVPVTGPIEVDLVDGYLTNIHPVILGSDNKAAVAALLVALRRVVDDGIPHAGIELLFTPCEEVGLKGAAAFDVSSLEARAGFVYDHTGPRPHRRRHDGEHRHRGRRDRGERGSRALHDHGGGART
jgi:tripeptide aminopeptidase